MTICKRRVNVQSRSQNWREKKITFVNEEFLMSTQASEFVAMDSIIGAAVIIVLNSILPESQVAPWISIRVLGKEIEKECVWEKLSGKKTAQKREKGTK